MKKNDYQTPEILVYTLQPGEVLCQSPVSAASIEEWVEDDGVISWDK